MTIRCHALPNETLRRYHRVMMSPKNIDQKMSKSRRFALIASITAVCAAGLVYTMTRPPVGLAHGEDAPSPAGIATSDADTSNNLVSLQAAGLTVPFTGTLRTDMSAAAVTAIISEANLEITEEGTFAGSVGCNSMGGAVSSAGDQLTFSELGTTLAMCSPELMAAEQEFTEIITAGTTFAVRDGALILNPGTDKELAFLAS